MKSKKLQETLDKLGKLKKVLPRKKTAPPTKVHKNKKKKSKKALQDYSKEVHPTDLS